MEGKITYIDILVTPDNIEKKEYVCNENDCLKKFTNELSLRKHINLIHYNISCVNQKVVYQYPCPIQSCRRNGVKKDYFKSRKFVAQHVHKSHNSEKFICGNGCNKKFSSQLLKNVHEKSCGKIFTCDFCNCSYNSNEALLTHRKRKNHFDASLVEHKKRKITKPISTVGTNTVTSHSKSTAIDEDLLIQVTKKSIKNSSTSTSDNFMKEENSNSLSSSSSQNNKKSAVSWNVSGEFEEDSITLFDSAETQTDFTESLFGNNFMNNFTQTTFTDFDDFEKFDSQTQTNWDEF